MKSPPRARVHRRQFLKASAGVAATAALSTSPLACGRGAPTPPADDGWNAGDVLHLLPTASHERIRLKASFREPLASAPQLALDGRRVAGARSDSNGRFFRFDVRGLEPDREHRLRLHRATGEPLCDDWPLRTFPAPDARPEHFRLLAYTCAGGPDNLYNLGFFDAFLDIPVRQRLLARALSFAPHAAVANGDHVYWDLQSEMGWLLGNSLRAWWVAGWFDREQPVLGTANERVLQEAFGPQIAGLYGVRFRSTPTFFLQDDHDYGENDEASEALRTFPADPFMLDLARSTQQLYYPELIADPGLPRDYVSADGVAESYGTLRYGALFEALLYDCRRHLSNAADPLTGSGHSAFVPPAIEAWLVERTVTSTSTHLAHMPSTPVLWTAGKWGEWYPDFQDEQGRLGLETRKPYWPEGWAAQHDRLLAAAVSRRDRIPLFASGDLHAIGAGRIHASNGRSFEQNPVVSLLTGPVSTGAMGWPSQFRGQTAQPSATLDAEELVAPIEENGFSLIDVTPGEIRVSMFGWKPEDGVDAIERLEPFEVVRFARA